MAIRLTPEQLSSREVYPYGWSTYVCDSNRGYPGTQKVTAHTVPQVPDGPAPGALYPQECRDSRCPAPKAGHLVHPIDPAWSASNMNDSPPHSQLTCEVDGCNNTLDYGPTDNYAHITVKAAAYGWGWTTNGNPDPHQWKARCWQHNPAALRSQETQMQRQTGPHELALVPAGDRRLLPEQCAARAEWHLLKAEEVSWDAEDDTFRGHLRMAEAWIQLGRMAASTD